MQLDIEGHRLFLLYDQVVTKHVVCVRVLTYWKRRPSARVAMAPADAVGFLPTGDIDHDVLWPVDFGLAQLVIEFVSVLCTAAMSSKSIPSAKIGSIRCLGIRTSSPFES